MLVIDILSLISDETTVFLVDGSNKTLAFYDGKNSIDAKYNSCVIDYIDTENDAIIIHLF